MNARKPNLNTVENISINACHVGDVLLARSGGSRYHIEEMKTRYPHGREVKIVKVRCFEEGEVSEWELPAAHLVRVQAEHECKCNGSGQHYGKGEFVNGVFTGVIDICFGCQGKGYQTRVDARRNTVYWNHYARV